jgi:hypothetical protein
MDWTVSDDAAGLIFLVLTLASLLAGALLSFRGLDSVDKAAERAADAADQARRAAEDMQTLTAEGKLLPNDAVAEVARVARVTSAVDTGVGEVKSALAELKGELAPARAFLALGLLFFLAALVSFDVIAIDFTAGDTTGTTTETTP